MATLLIWGFVAMLTFMGLAVFDDRALNGDGRFVLFLVSGFLLFKAFAARAKVAKNVSGWARYLASGGPFVLVTLVCGLTSFLLGKVSGISADKLLAVGIITFVWVQLHEVEERLDELKQQGKADSASLSETGPEA
jgi:uncharacterized membrane protein